MRAGPKGHRAIVYVLAGALLEGLSVSLLVPLLGLVGGDATPGWLQRFSAVAFHVFGANTLLGRLLLLLVVFGLLMLLRAWTLAARDIVVADLQFSYIETLRLRIIRRVANARWESIARLRHARITQIMSGDIQRLSIGLNFILSGSVASAMLLAQLALAYCLAPFAATIMVALLIVGSVALKPALNRSRRTGTVIAEANLSLLDSAVQFLGGLKLAVSQNLESGFVEESSRTLTNLVNRQVDNVRQYVRARAVATTLPALTGMVLVLAGIGWLHIAPAILVTLLLIVSRMIAPLGQVQQGLLQFAHTLAIYDQIGQLDDELAAAVRVRHMPTAPMDFPEGKIVFKNISFHHTDCGILSTDRGGLDKFNVTIERGEFLGVTGASGSGKTTFADLLAGLYPPQSGSINAGNIRLEGGVLEAWRNGLSYVSQDPFLFHDTIRRNLAWLKPTASEAEMWQALALADADALVRRMDRGLDTIVGERGILVSGGERQRLALARSLLRQPRLLILDEATGAIDGPGEREILTRLRHLRATIVLIAHRTENLDICDRIFHLENSNDTCRARTIVGV